MRVPNLAAHNRHGGYFEITLIPRVKGCEGLYDNFKILHCGVEKRSFSPVS